MNSIPLKEIVGFLPYGLKCQITENPLKDEIYVLAGINYDGLVSLGEGGQFGFIQRGFNQIKPLVRPLSDLTKSITHNGENFVPIVELFKIGINVKQANFEVKELKIEDDFYCVVALDNKKQEIVFGFDNKDKSFGTFYKNKTYSVFNQLELFHKMYELNFDIFDWIKDGKAIALTE